MSWVRGDHLWKTEPLIRTSDRERILRDFRNFFLTQTSERSLKKTVKRDSGAKLCVGVPEGWWLSVTPRGELADMEGRDMRPLMPTQEWVVVLGELKSPVVQHTSLYLLMGRESRLFVYSAVEDALVLAANDLDQFSRIGLGMVEFVFRVPSATMSVPSKGVCVWDVLCSCATSHELVKRLADYRNVMLELKTPGKRDDNPLILLDRIDYCFKHWPFCSMDQARLEITIKYISRRLCCRWYTIGLVGTYSSAGVFHALYLIVFDEHSAIYYLSTVTGELWRLADSVLDLRQLGLLKVFATGRRTDRDWIGIARLEHPPDTSLWFHGRRTAVHLFKDVAPMGDSQLIRQHVWMSREGRADLQSEEETAVIDNTTRLARLNLASCSMVNLPRSHVSAGPDSSLQEFSRAMWMDNDSWRLAKLNDVDSDEASDSLPFRDGVVPLPSRVELYDSDHSPAAIARRRITVASEMANVHSFHAPVIEPPRNIGSANECFECASIQPPVDTTPRVPPPTPFPSRRRAADGGVSGI
ncbi:b143 [Murid betaherpesvirus 8]|uniref:B143 n=3 Tax=Muromegalovirus TaxID=10365 RepID=K7YNS5_RCMVE|nr:e143 [Murid betaherpesvirus 8]AKE44297.1 a143 [Rat cytomegalovirus ALL-03]CAI64048.1 e143 protein [Murid betaherpesvirus 2]AFX83447.1 e143 [Murid betaherpesvirus 8]AKB93326.1 b143 [Murid betaherpesvirus 8]WEG71919.1 protein m143 [Murid betaherpesvirus 8]